MGTKADLLGQREPGTGKLAGAVGVWEGAGAPWERPEPGTVSWSSRLRVEPPVLLGQAQARLLKAPSLHPSCLLQHLWTGGHFLATAQAPLDRGPLHRPNPASGRPGSLSMVLDWPRAPVHACALARAQGQGLRTNVPGRGGFGWMIHQKDCPFPVRSCCFYHKTCQPRNVYAVRMTRAAG